MSAIRNVNPGRPDVLDVVQRARLEVVDADDAMVAAQELVAQVRAEEPCATGDETGGHVSMNTRRSGAGCGPAEAVGA